MNPRTAFTLLLSGLLVSVVGCTASNPEVAASRKASDAELKEARALYKSGRFKGREPARATILLSTGMGGPMSLTS
jgi:hypothetical protein